MHVPQFIVIPVSAFTTAAASSALESVLAEGRWHDWYAVGGRWENIFTSHQYGMRSLRDGNVLPIAGNEASVLNILSELSLGEDAAWARARHSLLGSTAVAAGHEGQILGIQTAENENHAQWITEENKAMSAAWNNILTAETLRDAKEASRGNMALYQISQILDMIEGRWGSDSRFFDSIRESANIHWFADRLRDGSIAKSEDYDYEKLALVIVDFHC
jgi:hypothetical protein